MALLTLRLLRFLALVFFPIATTLHLLLRQSQQALRGLPLILHGLLVSLFPALVLLCATLVRKVLAVLLSSTVLVLCNATQVKSVPLAMCCPAHLPLLVKLLVNTSRKWLRPWVVAQRVHWLVVLLLALPALLLADLLVVLHPSLRKPTAVSVRDNAKRALTSVVAHWQLPYLPLLLSVSVGLSA